VANQETSEFDPGVLENGTTYYWRIDEKNANGTTTGDVWSFTTQSVRQGKPAIPFRNTMQNMCGKIPSYNGKKPVMQSLTG
jgi:hypothetical protein